MPQKQCLIVLLACACAALGLGAPALAQPSVTAEQLSDLHIQNAVDAIVEELYARKHPERMWEPEKIPAGDSTRQKGGYTALVILAMLHAGQSYQDERLRDAVQYLQDFPIEGTYALAIRNSVWARLPPKFADKLAADTQWFLDGFSEKVGGWDYVQDARTNRKDNSIRQFGALALWEAAKRGVKIEERYWRHIEDALIAMQVADGGWNYTGDGPTTGSMTAAGLATLFITLDFLHGVEAVKLSSAPRNARHEQAIARGLHWMDQNFSPAENPGRDTYFYYYLYGVERVGLASGYKFFGKHDWYRDGAVELIRRLCKWDEAQQKYSIHATTAGDSRASKVKTDDLAFALMFLSRGRVPVAINKLTFDRTAERDLWNNRPRDVANLTAWIRDNSETELNWQIIDFESEPEQWLDAPMVYLASDKPLTWMKDLDIDADKFTREVREFLKKRAAGEVQDGDNPPPLPDSPELAKLKRYLELGGMILALNEGNAKLFAKSVEDAGLLMFPQYHWRNLPDDHWAYTIHAPVKGRKPVLRGLSNGVRELIILSAAGDLPENFQRNNEKQTGEFQTAMNIYFYASELNRPRPRMAEHVKSNANTSELPAQAVVVRAQHGGNWKPEPQALTVFASYFAQSRAINLGIVDAPLSNIHALETKPALVMVSGVDEHAFTPAEIESIKTYVNTGGRILFETAGGRGSFTLSAEQIIAQTFNQSIESLLRDPVITGEGMQHAANLSRVEYRPFSLQHFGVRETTPRLRGMRLKPDQPPCIFFSREDISHALLDQPSWGISGYSPQSARDLLANILQRASSKGN